MSETKNKQFSALPKNRENRNIPVLMLKDAVAQTYDTSISSDTEIALNSATSLIEITVIDAPVFLKAKTATGGTAVSSSNFDLLLPVGRHTFGLLNNITHISLIEQSSGAIIAVSEFSY